MAREMNNAPLQAEALANQAALFMESGQGGRALSVSREAVARANAAHDQRLILLTRLQAAEASQSVRDLVDVARKASAFGLAPIEAATHMALARVHLAAGRTKEASLQAEHARGVAAPMHLRDVLFQACYLGAKALKAQGQATSAVDQFSASLGYLEEMRRGLAGADLRLFLGRPVTVAFAKDAEPAFQNANRPQDSARLRALLSP